MDAVAFIGLGHKFQIWAPDRLGPQLSEATGSLRSLRKRLSGQACGGQTARSTGTMTGSDGGYPAVAGGLARHIPVLCARRARLPQRQGRRHLYRRHFRRRRLHARDARCRRLLGDRHRSRPERDRRGRGSRRDTIRPARTRAGRASPRSTTSRATAATNSSTAWCSISASPRCSSTRPSAAFPSAMTARSTCAWDATARARRMWSRRRPIAILPASSSTLGEERHARAVARAIVRGAGKGADPHHARARRHRRARRACAPGRDPSGDAHLPGACAFS